MTEPSTRRRIAATVLVQAWRREPPQPGFLSVGMPLLLLGAIVGAVWRVFTAGVIGANIGAGILMLFGWPIVLAWWRSPASRHGCGGEQGARR